MTFATLAKYKSCHITQFNMSYLLDLESFGLPFSEHEQVEYTAHGHQWWEVIQLQIVCGVLGQHMLLQVGSVKQTTSTFVALSFV